MIEFLILQSSTFETIPSKYYIPFGTQEVIKRFEDAEHVQRLDGDYLPFTPLTQLMKEHIQLPSFTMTKTCRQISYDVSDYVRSKQVLIQLFTHIISKLSETYSENAHPWDATDSEV